MKTALIFDIHNRVELADAAIQAAGADKVVFFGDYFDDFHDGPKDARATALWVQERMKRHPEDIWLLGNHDASYAFGSRLYDCPGWTPDKQRAVTNVLKEGQFNILTSMKLHHWEQDWLCSHAGITRWLFPVDSPDFEQNRYVVDERCRLALERARHGELDSAINAVGHARGGRCMSGGILWQCWSEFRPIKGINQIVGHTPDKEVRYRSRPLKEQMLWGRIYVRVEDEEADFVSDNYCGDTNSRFYGLIEEGQVTFHQTPII